MDVSGFLAGLPALLGICRVYRLPDSPALSKTQRHRQRDRTETPPSCA